MAQSPEPPKMWSLITGCAEGQCQRKQLPREDPGDVLGIECKELLFFMGLGFRARIENFVVSKGHPCNRNSNSPRKLNFNPTSQAPKGQADNPKFESSVLEL